MEISKEQLKKYTDLIGRLDAERGLNRYSSKGISIFIMLQGVKIYSSKRTKSSAR